MPATVVEIPKQQALRTEPALDPAVETLEVEGVEDVAEIEEEVTDHRRHGAPGIPAGQPPSAPGTPP